jgi:hypothetical protein
MTNAKSSDPVTFQSASSLKKMSYEIAFIESMIRPMEVEANE